MISRYSNNQQGKREANKHSPRPRLRQLPCKSKKGNLQLRVAQSCNAASCKSPSLQALASFSAFYLDTDKCSAESFGHGCIVDEYGRKPKKIKAARPRTAGGGIYPRPQCVFLCCTARLSVPLSTSRKPKTESVHPLYPKSTVVFDGKAGQVACRAGDRTARAPPPAASFPRSRSPRPCCCLSPLHSAAVRWDGRIARAGASGFRTHAPILFGFVGCARRWRRENRAWQRFRRVSHRR
jgi:hypothetical protein